MVVQMAVGDQAFVDIFYHFYQIAHHAMIEAIRIRNRVTMAEVAEYAGVGVATVDRVLNARAPVRAKTAERVIEAARTLGYQSDEIWRQKVDARRPAKRLGFVLQKKSKPFYRHLAAELERAASGLGTIRAEVRIAFVDALSPGDLADAIEAMAGEVDAMAVVAIDHPRVNTAVDGVGIPVFALLSPLSAKKIAGYVGIDGRKAGRTAGWAMARLVQSGPIGILVGSHRYLGHEALEVGFRSYMRECAPHMTLRESIVYLDDANVAYEAACELFRRAPDLNGLYHCGGGVSGVLRALEETGRAARLVYLCHEAGQATRMALSTGAVAMAIATPLPLLAEQLTLAMEQRLVFSANEPLIHVDFQIKTPENI